VTTTVASSAIIKEIRDKENMMNNSCVDGLHVSEPETRVSPIACDDMVTMSKRPGFGAFEVFGKKHLLTSRVDKVSDTTATPSNHTPVGSKG
jgi:hypothetical protein